MTLSRITLISLLCLLLGCSSTFEVRSRKANNIGFTVKRMFVYVKVPERVNVLLDPMKAEMGRLIVANGDSIAFFQDGPVSVDDSQYVSEAAKFGPDAVLFLRCLNGPQPDMTNLTFDAILTDRTMRENLWRANVKASFYVTATGVATPWEYYGQEMAKELVRKLDEDSLISLKVKIHNPQSDTSHPNPAVYSGYH